MKRILVADDGSEPALMAVEIAAHIAAKTGAELVALAVIDPDRIKDADVAALTRSERIGDAEALERLVEASAGYLQRCQNEASRAGVALFRQTYRSASDVALEIAEFARAEETDLIRRRLPRTRPSPGASFGKRVAKTGISGTVLGSGCPLAQ